MKSHSFLLKDIRLIPKGRPVTVRLKKPKINKYGKMIYVTTFTPQKTKDCEKEIKLRLRSLMKDKAIFTGLISVDVYLQIKNSRADIDNLLKLLFDSMNGEVFEDDSQIAKVSVMLNRKSDKNNILITIKDIEYRDIIEIEEYLFKDLL